MLVSSRLNGPRSAALSRYAQHRPIGAWKPGCSKPRLPSLVCQFKDTSASEQAPKPEQSQQVPPVLPEEAIKANGNGFSSSQQPLSQASDVSPQLKREALQSVDSAHMGDGFVQRRLIVFVGIVLAYMGLYFTRGTLTYSAPALVADPAMSLTLKDIGAMTSAFPLAYGVSKFVGGVMGAKFSPTVMLAGGLAITAALNLCTTLPGVTGLAITALWAMNGCVQGIGAPASAQLLTQWFASKERGTYWGLWNMGANIGGFLTPICVGFLATAYGWRYGMAVPAAAAIAISIFAFSVIRDKPSDAGFAPVEQVSANGEKPSITAALKEVMTSPGTWLLAFTYFFVYVVRQGATSWLVFYLMAEKGAVNAAAAARTVSGLELGGLFGGTLAGVMSDMRIKSAGSEDGHVGRRVQIVMAYIVATFGVLALLKAVPASSQWLQWATIFALGFCIYGPQMLIGLCGAEMVNKPAVGASQGLLGLISYIGAANAGLPLSHIVTNYGWNGYFVAMASASAAAFLLLTPLVNQKSKIQQRTAAPAAA